MTNPDAGKKALEIVDAFMDTQFDEETEAAAWLVKRISEAIAEAEKAEKA